MTTPTRWTKLSPVDETPLATYTATSAREVLEAVNRAQQAFQAFQSITLKQRGQLLRQMASALLRDADTLAHLIHQETGKPLEEAYGADLLTAVGVFDYYGSQAPRWLRPQRLPIGKGLLMGRLAHEHARPLGVVGIISPWNYPMGIPASGIATALAAGNAVLLKPSEHTPAVALRLGWLLRQTLKAHGLPTDLVQVLPGDGETGQALAESRIQGLVFTGSHATGTYLQRLTAGRGLALILEMGGSDPMILLDGCDWDAATTYAVWGRFSNAGQTCAAVKRLLVPQAQLPTVLALLTHKLAQVPVSPLISAQQRTQVHQQVKAAMAKGAHCLRGGELPTGPGFYYPPTLLTQVAADNPVWTQEVFGPVLPVMGYETVEEAVALANGSAMGLGASVFGPGAANIAPHLQAGTVGVHEVPMLAYALPGLPWRGIKHSGMGASHGQAGLLGLTRPQVVLSNVVWPVLRKMPWHFGPQPSTDFARVLVKRFARPHAHPALLWAWWRHRKRL
jgi:acyl-CoA reductase-like NAD-dependent aldehyde dehydrogenase